MKTENNNKEKNKSENKRVKLSTRSSIGWGNSSFNSKKQKLPKSIFG